MQHARVAPETCKGVPCASGVCNVRFLLFSHGGESYARQSLLSACSILAQNPCAEVAVYTDSPKIFASIPVSIFPITPSAVLAMSGPLEFRHRIKIQLIQKHLAEIQESEPVCYIDSDTFCHRPFPTALREEAFVHCLEGRVGSNFHPRFHRFLAENRSLLASAGCADFSENLTMFNCGLLYLPGTSHRKELLEKVLNLTDILCLWFSEQMEWLEQAAFSYYLPKYFPTRANDCGFLHYWQPNQEVGLLLKKMPLNEIKTLASDTKRFEALCADAHRIRQSSLYKWRLRIAKLRRSIKKRILIRRAARLRNA